MTWSSRRGGAPAHRVHEAPPGPSGAATQPWRVDHPISASASEGKANLRLFEFRAHPPPLLSQPMGPQHQKRHARVRVFSAESQGKVCMRLNTGRSALPPQGGPASGSDVTGSTSTSPGGSTASQAGGPPGRSATGRRESSLSQAANSPLPKRMDRAITVTSSQSFSTVSDGMSSFAASSTSASLSSRHSAAHPSDLDIAGAVTTINSEASLVASRDTTKSQPKSETGPRPGLPRNLAFASLQQATSTPTSTPTPTPTPTPAPTTNKLRMGVTQIGRFLQPVLGQSRHAKPEPSPIVDAPRPAKPSFTERARGLGDELREKALAAKDQMAKRSR
jgi:hypothetical protein